MFAISAFAADFKGTVVDSGCGAKHADASEKSAACVKACVNGKGMAPVLAAGDKIYKLSDAKLVAEHLGHKVVVTGALEGETIKIASVKMDH